MLPAGDAGFPQPGLDVPLGFAGGGAVRQCWCGAGGLPGRCLGVLTIPGAQG